MAHDPREEGLLRSVALRNAQSILAARQNAEEEARRANRALEQRSDELARSLAVMRATLEATTDGILVIDRHRRVTAYNENYARMWQPSADVVRSGEHRRLLEACSVKFRNPQRFLDRADDIYRSADDESFDVLELLDGRVIERFSRIQYVDGQSVGRVWSFRDITARRRAEEELRNEAGVLELLNQTGRLIASSLELPAVLQAVTDAATRISGAAYGAFFYSAGDEYGNVVELSARSGAASEAFALQGRPRATALLAPTLRGEGPIRCNDVRSDPRFGAAPQFVPPGGQPPLCSYLAVPVPSRTGEPIGGLFFGHPETGVFGERSERIVVGIATQASIAIDNARLYEQARRLAIEREQLIEVERALRSDVERASRTKDEFLATLSHELRTPLTAILGWSSVLLLKSSDPDNLQKGLQAIQRNARSQAQLIEDLLDMSAIASGKVRLEAQPTDLVAVVQAALDAVRLAAEAKAIELSVSLDSPADATVHGDPGRLQQVVGNLLCNSLKFTPHGGLVRVALHWIDGGCEIRVSDTGAGISREFLAHVFDRFRQADSSNTRRYGGLGLGLSIVKQLVELHGGSVRAESEGAGQGATFIVSLPTISASASERREARRPGERQLDAIGERYLEGLEVLVVEDEPDSRTLIQHLLTEHGATVTTASDAAEGLSLLHQVAPRVLISDIGMPGVDGIEFLEAVRRLPSAAAAATPAIALTAFAGTEDRKRALAAGFQRHLAKPIDRYELVAMVGNLAGRAEPGGS